jgi:hypothetical protein
MLATVDEMRVDTEGHVVEEDAAADAPDVYAPLAPGFVRRQRPDRVVAVESYVAGEVIAGPERNADERDATLECHLGDRAERTVAAGHADRPCRRTRDGRRVVALLQDVHGDAASLRLAGQFLRVRAPVPRARIDEK